MAENKPDMSCARVKQLTSSNIGAAERHNERKNKTYENLNVVPERIPMNVHYVDPGEESYMDILRRLEDEGKVSLRGLRPDATIFDEVLIDVNTMYFENRGGYEYARQFYADATEFLISKFGKDYVISSVMHADELNKAATADLGQDVYHYHLHAVVLPVVEKEIRWSKRCKDPALVGTVKEVIHQISHSKKWASTKPERNDYGDIIYRKNGKIKYRKSYSILQDELIEFMQEKGYTDIQRGVRGSNAEHLESLQFQINKDMERLAEIEEKVRVAEIEYAPVKEISETLSSIDEMGSRTITGKIAVSKEDYGKLTALAREGITSRGEIGRLKEKVSDYRDRLSRATKTINRLEGKLEELTKKCKPFLDALEHFPALVKTFTEKVRALFAAREKAERIRKESQKRLEHYVYGDFHRSHSKRSRDDDLGR